MKRLTTAEEATITDSLSRGAVAFAAQGELSDEDLQGLTGLSVEPKYALPLWEQRCKILNHSACLERAATSVQLKQDAVREKERVAAEKAAVKAANKAADIQRKLITAQKNVKKNEDLLWWTKSTDELRAACTAAAHPAPLVKCFNCPINKDMWQAFFADEMQVHTHHTPCTHDVIHHTHTVIHTLWLSRKRRKEGSSPGGSIWGSCKQCKPVV